MARYVTLLALMLAILAAVPVSAQDEELEKAVGSLRTELGDSETDAQSAGILKNFLKEFPDTKYTASVLNAIAYYQGEAGGDHAGALAFVEAHIAKLEEEDHINGSKVVLAGLYDSPEYAGQLRAVVEELGDDADLSFRNYTNLIFSSFGAEQWDLALELLEPAVKTASSEAVREDYPDASDEIVEERSASRMLDLGVYRGWALANTGGQDKALKLFESAAKRSEVDYFGVPEGMVNVYWGKTLVMKGESEAALDKLLPMALWAGSESAKDAVMELFEKGGGCEEDFDHYMLEQRVKHARSMDSFAAKDYEAVTHQSKDLMGKVTLVAFWFPT
jgi:hypothetical protein